MHASLDPSTIRPLRRVEFMALARTGVFDDERVELLYGMVVRMGKRARVRPEGPFAASDDFASRIPLQTFGSRNRPMH